MSIVEASPLESHLRRFGLRSFRAGQREVIDSVMSGKNCLCIMPTGGGKSLCFQLPAVARPGLVLVVSPLIALMKDQVDTLNGHGIAATYINSTVAPPEQFERLRDMAEGKYDLVYVAPERFRSGRFIDAVKRANIQLLAIDEAHCISEWGHDFRHDYSRLGRYRRQMGNPQTIALTATATPDVQKDILVQLETPSARTFVAGFARPNLKYSAIQSRGGKEQSQALLQLLGRTTGSGIVYASTRKRCEEIAEVVREQTRRPVDVYHAGRELADRKRVQEAFMSGKTEIIVATNAFGMGIDKPDVRFVVHYNLPGTLEAYYQEAGRAGRDGDTSECLLIYSPSDRYIQEFFIENSYPSPDTIEKVYEYLRTHSGDPIELTQQELREELDLSISKEGIGTCEKLLEGGGVLERLEPRENMAAVRIDSDLSNLVDLLPSNARNQRKVLAGFERLVGKNRGERVYFHPHRLAESLEMESPSLQRAIRELTRLELFDYVPPFRGRAIHMLIRDKPFHQLTLDLDSLTKRRAEQYAKLDRVVRYVHTSRCRQNDILEYFGAPLDENCHTCDRCLTGRPSQATGAQQGSDHDSINQAVRIVLSGVARSRERFGKTMIAAMLCGSKSAKVVRWKLDQLSTFGLLRDLKQDEVGSLIEALVIEGLLEQTNVEKFRPIVKLTPRGTEVMLGNESCQSPLPIEDELRRKIIVFLPATEEKRSTSPAVPSSPAASVESDNGPSHVLPPEPPPEKEPALPPMSNFQEGAQADAGNSPPPCFWTWRLLSSQFSINECSLIRRLSREEVLDHLVQAVEVGLPLTLDAVLSDEAMALLRQVDLDCHPESAEGLFSNLPETLSRREAELYWLLRSL